MTQRLKKEQLDFLAHERNHVILTENFDEIYKNVHTKIKIQCLTCGHIFETTVQSYKNAKKTGCPSCKNLVASKTHKNKNVSQETRALIGQKASQRPGSLLGVTGPDHPCYRGGYGRDLTQRSTLDYEWINAVKKIYNKRCVLTGAKEDLHCHHLEGWNRCPERRYDITNGVCIHRDVHKAFHQKYGYGNNTESQLAVFCQENYSVDWYSLKESFGNHQPNLTSSDP